METTFFSWLCISLPLKVVMKCSLVMIEKNLTAIEWKSIKKYKSKINPRDAVIPEHGLVEMKIYHSWLFVF